MKHTSYSFNITSKNTKCIPTWDWHFLLNILIFFIPIYLSIFNVTILFFYKSSAGVSDFLTNEAIVLQFHNILDSGVYIKYFYLAKPLKFIGKKVCHTKCATLLGFLTIYYDGNCVWKEIFQWYVVGTSIWW